MSLYKITVALLISADCKADVYEALHRHLTWNTVRHIPNSSLLDWQDASFDGPEPDSGESFKDYKPEDFGYEAQSIGKNTSGDGVWEVRDPEGNTQLTYASSEKEAIRRVLDDNA